MEESTFVRAMIAMWNSHFSKTIYKRIDGHDIKFNIIDMFNLNPVNFDSNKKLGIWEAKHPSVNLIIPSKDGLKIAASIWLNDQPTNKWIIGIHGYNSSRIDVLYLTWHYRQLGYNLITFDFRNHGASDNDVVTWGFKEKWDLISVIEWLIKAYHVEQIGMVGTSMGGFTMNYFLLTEPELIKKAKIKWAICDSGYMSVPKLLERMILINTPKMLESYVKQVIKIMLKIYKNEYDVDLAKLDFASLIEPQKKYLPVLYLHNRWDKITDSLDSFRMWDMKNNIENSNKNELKIFDGKHHTKAIIEYNEEYKNLTLEFVKKHEN